MAVAAPIMNSYFVRISDKRRQALALKLQIVRIFDFNVFEWRFTQVNLSKGDIS